MRILITGLAGFIGSHLADALSEDDHTVYGIDNLTTGSKDNVVVPCVYGDISDRQQFYETANLLHPELVIHCAASYSDPNRWHRDTDTNVTGSINAALVAKHHRARLVYFQTVLPPISSYAISKIAGEQYIRLSGVPALIFRLAIMYGPRNKSGAIPTFYKRLANEDACTVTDTSRDFVYIDDLVDLVTRAIDDDATGTYDVCSGEQHTIGEVYDLVRQAVGSSASPKTVAASGDDVKTMPLNPDATAKDFMWSATTSLEDGVRQTVDWYDRHGVTDTYTHLTLRH